MKRIQIDITEGIRNDYDQFLMGQKRQIDIAAKRKLPISHIVKAFDILFHEKRLAHINQKQAT